MLVGLAEDGLDCAAAVFGVGGEFVVGYAVDAVGYHLAAAGLGFDLEGDLHVAEADQGDFFVDGHDDGAAAVIAVDTVPASGGKWGMYVCDALGRGPGRDMPGLGGRLLALGGTRGGAFGVSRLFRWMMTKDRALLKRWLDEQASRDDLAFVWVAHGDPLVMDVSDTLRRAAAAL